MIERVLVAMDGSDLAEQALRYALDAHRDAELTVIHVVGGGSPMMGEATGLALSDRDDDGGIHEAAEPVFERAQQIAAEHDRTVETLIAAGRPAHTIIDHAERFDTVVLGTHNSSLADRLLVGNVAKTVFQKSPVPVTVVR